MLMLPLDQHVSWQPAAVIAAKLAVYHGFRAAAESAPGCEVGIIADEESGRMILRDAAVRGFTTACAIGTIDDPRTDADAAAVAHARACSATYWKVGIHYNPDGPGLSKTRQVVRMRRFSELVLQPAGVPLMCDLVVPPTAAQIASGIWNFDRSLLPALTVRAMREMLDAGVEPDVWVIEGFDRRDAYERVVEAAARGARPAGCFVRAAGHGDETTRHRMAVGLSVTGIVGVILGRAPFWEPAVEWMGGRRTRATAVATVAARVRSWVEKLGDPAPALAASSGHRVAGGGEAQVG